MSEKWTHELVVGEIPEPLEFTVTPEFNQQYMSAEEDYHTRYQSTASGQKAIVHPALLINYSNITRSPSFRLPPGIATVHTHEEIEFLNSARVGDTFTVRWKIVDVYEKRGRFYQTKEALITNQDSLPIIRRVLTDTFMIGKG